MALKEQDEPVATPAAKATRVKKKPYRNRACLARMVHEPAAINPGAFAPRRIFLYQTEDARTRVQIRLTDGTLWLTQKQLSELYQVSVPTINGHLRTIYNDGEAEAERTIRKFRIVAPEGARTVERLTDHYNLDVVLQVGYRVRSHRGAQFRRWVTNLLNAYLTEGVALDDARFKNGEDAAYFERLLPYLNSKRTSLTTWCLPQ